MQHIIDLLKKIHTSLKFFDKQEHLPGVPSVNYTAHNFHYQKIKRQNNEQQEVSGLGPTRIYVTHDTIVLLS